MANTPKKNESEAPPSLDFEINWATHEERKLILQTMVQNHRQTMNFRTMPTAKLLVMRDRNDLRKIVGWEGLDYQHNPKFPEVFSQYVAPEYRTYLLGLALSHACASFLQSVGVKNAFLRMEAESNSDLLELRKSSIYRILESEELDQQWVSECQKCELKGSHCKVQAYLTYKVDDWVQFGNKRLGRMAILSFPAQILLRKENFRNFKEDTVRYRAKWVA